MRTVADHPEVDALIARRRTLGQDRYDEIWEGVYHMTPDPHVWHSYVQVELTSHLSSLVRGTGLTVSATFNLGTAENFRVPDLGIHRGEVDAVFLPTAAVVGEILSPGDETWAKFPFYASHSVDEVLVVDYTARTMQLFALTGGDYAESAHSDVLNQGLRRISAISWPGQRLG